MAEQPRTTREIRAAFLRCAQALLDPTRPITGGQAADALEQVLGPKYCLGAEQRQINPVLRALRGQTR
jgi:hypothetical protein